MIPIAASEFTDLASGGEITVKIRATDRFYNPPIDIEIGASVEVVDPSGSYIVTRVNRIAYYVEAITLRYQPYQFEHRHTSQMTSTRAYAVTLECRRGEIPFYATRALLSKSLLLA